MKNTVTNRFVLSNDYDWERNGGGDNFRRGRAYGDGAGAAQSNGADGLSLTSQAPTLRADKSRVERGYDGATMSKSRVGCRFYLADDLLCCGDELRAGHVGR